MNVVLVGLGKFGITLVDFLLREGHNVVAIDLDSKIVDTIVNTYDVMGICGNGASCSVLEEAEIDKANLFISTTLSDELNIVCCMIAKKMGAKNTVARVRNPEYAHQSSFMRNELGIGMMINPELETANEISRILRTPSAIKMETFAKGRVELAEILIEEKSPLIGEPLSSLYKKFHVMVLVCAVSRDDEVYIPTGDFVLQKDDKIHITASHTEMGNFFKAIGIYKQKAKKVIIIGGSKITYYLARQLSEMKMTVKVIENDQDRCEELSQILPKANIICGDGTDQNLLIEEGIEDADALISLTGIDEENIIVSLYAMSKEVSTVITKVNRTNLLEMLYSLNMHSIITPRIISANIVLQYARAKQNATGSKVKTLYKIVNEQVEALEFIAAENMPFLGITLRELQIKKDILIASIIRGNKIIIPRGDDHIEANDSVIVIAKNELLSDLEDILQ